MAPIFLDEEKQRQIPLAAVASKTQFCASLPESTPLLTWSRRGQPCSLLGTTRRPSAGRLLLPPGADPEREQLHFCSIAGTLPSLSREFCSLVFQDTSSNLTAFPSSICRRHTKRLVPLCSPVHAPCRHQRCTACSAPMQ